jgi:MFS transporter, DHA1 family, solute carrier family 18 (vesicular amine transporter), member 1/2
MAGQSLKQQDHPTLSSHWHSRAMVFVVVFSLFIDYFLYGLLFPLAAHSPSGLKGEREYALLYGVYAISVLLVTPVFGYLGNRIGGRLNMLYGAALAVCAIALFGLTSSFSLLLLAKICQGAASAALWTSGLALIAADFAEQRVEMLGYAFAGGTFGSVAGPIAGGFLYHLGGYKFPFLITGLLIAIDVALIARFLPRSETIPNETVPLRTLVFSNSVAIPALAFALAAFSLGLIDAQMPVRLARAGVTSMTIGLMFTIGTLVYGLSAPLVGRVSNRLPIGKVIVLGTIGMAAALPLLAIFNGVILVCAVLALVNISYALMLNPASAELGNVVDRSGLSCYSTVYAVFNIFYSIGMLGTATLASSALRLVDFRGVLLCASGILLLSITVLKNLELPQKAVTASSGG